MILLKESILKCVAVAKNHSSLILWAALQFGCGSSFRTTAKNTVICYAPNSCLKYEIENAKRQVAKICKSPLQYLCNFLITRKNKDYISNGLKWDTIGMYVDWLQSANYFWTPYDMGHVSKFSDNRDKLAFIVLISCLNSPWYSWKIF